MKTPRVNAAAAAELVACLDAAFTRFMRHERGTRDDRVTLTRLEFHFIRAAGLRGAGAMGALARELAMTESGLTAVADRLVAKGLLERRRDAADRRIVRVALSAAGRRFYNGMMRARARMAVGMLGALSADERERFLALFRKISGGAGEPGVPRRGARRSEAA